MVCGGVVSRVVVVVMVVMVVMVVVVEHSAANPDAKKLYSDLMSNYNRLIRPVKEEEDCLTVRIGMKLSQLIDIDERNQVMTTNIWLIQEWNDYKLTWDPEDYGGVDALYIPAQQIWTPDVVLFNNADGNYEVNDRTKATVHYDGRIEWLPPAIYKSSCTINVMYFPFDEQQCDMKFASWTYDGSEVDLLHINQTDPALGGDPHRQVPDAIDMRGFLRSVEWDVLAVPAQKNYYQSLPDITFFLTIRRKALFYTINLIIPCIGISFLTVLVFYLPSDSGEKMALSVNILVTLTFFFLVLSEIIPPTSLVVPLIGKYLLFTMILVTLSIFITVGVLNVNYRSVSTHKMPPWMRRVFLCVLPRLLFMRRPDTVDEKRHKMRPTNRKMTDKNGDVTSTKQGVQPPLLGNDTSTTPAVMDTKVDAVGGTETAVALVEPGEQAFGSRLSPGCISDIPFADLTPNSCCTPTSCQGAQLHSTKEQPAPHDTERLTTTLGNSTPTQHNSPCKIHQRRVEREKQIQAERIVKAMRGVLYIEQHVRKGDETKVIKEDWKYVAMVLDRLFLWIFTIACVVGTIGIIMQAPTLYDKREAIGGDSFSATMETLTFLETTAASAW